MTREVTVVGCGVIGLTSAIRLQERGFHVVIVTRDIPPHVTSAVAGAMWYGYGMEMYPRRQKWAKASLDAYLQLNQAEGESCGVLLRKIMEVYPQPVPLPWFKDLIPACERVTATKLPTGYADGFLIEVPVVETPTYLRYLVDRFCEHGGLIEQRTVKSLTELVEKHELIVNCTGVWARYVADDPAVHPLRGQVIKVDLPDIPHGFMDDYSFTYIYPRNDGVVLGGIVQADNWSLEIDQQINEDILRRCARFAPAVRQAKVIAELAGLRPGRYDVRLEHERVGNTAIIHNYGHGGVGFTLSWGCAQEVADTAEQLIV
jgi:D-amino-acid oxidase